MYSIQFAKLRENAVIPSKRDEDSDYDLYACFDEEEFVIPAFSTRLIPTGIISAFDENLGVKFEERGSNTKWCGIVQAGVIDSGYRGEILFKYRVVQPHISRYCSGDRIGQIVIVKLPEFEMVEAENLSDSDREAGGFGSTGR